MREKSENHMHLLSHLSMNQLEHMARAVGVVAVDVPSGLNPDTGEANKRCVNADMTVTFHRMKVGMPKSKRSCAEKTFVEKIGIPPEAEIGVL